MRNRSLFLFFIIFLISFLSPQRGLSAVTLKYFDVQWDGVTQQVKIRWETATELDNLGFQVRRKITGSSGSFGVVKLCAKASGCAQNEKEEFIFAGGDTLGRLYGDYFDNEIQGGISYTYQLIAIDTSQREEIAETKTVFTSGQTNSTASPTSGSLFTATSTVTATSLSPTSTPRQGNPQRTPTPVSPSSTVRIVQPTATPAIGTLLQESTVTPEPLPTETPVELVIPTLPLPSITLIFPNTPTAPIETPMETPEVGTIPQNANWFTPSRLFVIGLIVFIWIILGGWFVFALRKIQ